MGQGSKRIVEDFDKEKQVKKLTAQVSDAVYQTAAMELGAVGLVGYFLTMSYQASQVNFISIIIPSCFCSCRTKVSAI